MSNYVNGLVVEVEKAHETSPHGQQGPVSGLYVGVELQVLRDLPAAQKRLFRPHVESALVRTSLARVH